MAKVTKREMFTEIETIAMEMGRLDIVDFCKAEKELLARKSSKSAPTKVQKENLVILEQIIMAMENLGKPVTISEFQSDVPSMENYSNQKLSALFKKLVDSGRLVKTIDKKKSYFSIAN